MAHFKEIIERYFKRDADRETSALFAEWLSSDIDSEQKDEVLQEQWEKDYYMSPEAVSESYRRVMKRIDRTSSRRNGTLRQWIYPVAASVILAAAVLIRLIPEKTAQEILEPEMLECYVHNGEKQVMTLPDSTVVILNSGSILIYPDTFAGAERKVYLMGEAIFDVTGDASRPFIVNTEEFSVKVLGTLFNVSSYMDADCSSATLKEGSISISSSKGEQYLLSPNQTFRFEKGTGKVSIMQSDVDEAFAWKDGKLCFRSENIHSIIRKMERYYDVRVYLTTGRYDDEQLTAKFIHGETVEEMLSAICLLVPGMEYSIDNDNVYIR